MNIISGKNTVLTQETEIPLTIAAILSALFLTLLINFNGSVSAEESCVWTPEWTPDDPCESEDIDPPDFSIPPSAEYRGVVPPPQPGTTGIANTTSPTSVTGSGGVTQFSNWKSHFNNNTGIKFVYPPTWDVSDNDNNETNILPLDSTDRNSVGILISKIVWQGGLNELAYKMAIYANLGKGTLTKVTEGDLPLPIDSYGIQFTLTKQGETFFFDERFFRNDYSPYVYVVKYITKSPQLWAKYHPEFEEISNSLSLRD